ncbi:MAG: F-box protein [Chlamydiales bacterium]
MSGICAISSPKKPKLETTCSSQLFSALPQDLLTSILLYADPSDVLSSERVSHSFAKAIPLWAKMTRTLDLDNSCTIEVFAKLFGSRSTPFFPNVTTLKVSLNFAAFLESKKKQETYTQTKKDINEMIERIPKQCPAVQQLTVRDDSDGLASNWPKCWSSTLVKLEVKGGSGRMSITLNEFPNLKKLSLGSN